MKKIFVICQTAATAIQLEQILREREAIRAAVFHEKCRLSNGIEPPLILRI